MKNQKGLAPIAIILIIAGVLVLGGGAWYWQSQKSKIYFPPPLICNQKTKVCPDGTIVGRISQVGCGEFAACPIATSTVTSTITVLSPNGGEKWQIGKSYIISWSHSSQTANINNNGLTLTVRRIDKVTGKDLFPQISLVENGSDSGSYTWVIPSTITIEGSVINLNDSAIVYKVHVSDRNLITHVFEHGTPDYAADDSDAPFSIVTPTVSIPNWQTYSNYGFQVQCPPFLTVWDPNVPDAYLYSVSFENPLASQSTSSQKIVFNVSIFKDNNQLQDAFKTLTLEDQGKVTIGGYQAEKLFAARGIAVSFTEATIYTITAKNTALIFYGSDFSEISQNDLNTILSTFKFTK